MNKHFNQFARTIVITSLMIVSLTASALAQGNTIRGRQDINLALTGQALTKASAPVFVSGTGPVRLSGRLIVQNSACMRVKVDLIRSRFSFAGVARPIGGIVPSIPDSSLANALARGIVLKTQTFEFCGAANISLADNLNASEDDAFLSVRVTNIDDWNKMGLAADLNLTFPTAQQSVTIGPFNLLTLNQGQDENRTFQLVPNTPGKLRIEATWDGNARLRVTLSKPNGGQALQPQTSTATGSLTFEYNIQPADITSGNQWKLNVLNVSQQPITAQNIRFRVIYTVQE